jgi:type II secretory pathway pseudopilin PulG
MTLLEVLVALLIVSLTTTAALATVSTQLRAADRAQRAMEGAALARYEMSIVRLQRPEDFPSLPDSVAHGAFPPPFSNHSFTTRAEPVSGTEYLYDVEVRVEWPNGSYSLRSRVFAAPDAVRR